MKRIVVVIILYCVTVSVAGAQTRLDTFIHVPDSAKPFTLGNFYELILLNHPVAKQTALLTEVAKQEIRLARGNFDPKLEAEFLSKQYEGKEYYTIFNSSLKFPTVFPVDPIVGVEKNTGVNLNPERYISDEYNYQQFYAGIAIPLGKGLITDERRAALRQAELFQTMTEAEQVKAINKLLLEAAKLYWQWYYAYYNYQLFNRSMVVANEIFDRVKANYSYGEASVVDTLQAKITLQQRTIEQQEAWLDYQNQGINVSTYLWDSLTNPLMLEVHWVPVLPEGQYVLQADEVLALSELARDNHPELQKLDVKLQQLEVERKLASEFLKPQLNLNYYLLNQPIAPDGSTALVLNDNYKLGIDFSFPIFLRKERSKLALTKLKLSNTTFEKSLTERTILNDITSSYNRLINLQRIVETQREMAINYERLLQAELLNLEQGESDLFKVNIQMDKVIASQSKWLKLTAEYEKEKAYLYWASGIKNLNRE